MSTPRTFRDAGSLFVKHEEGYALAEMPDDSWRVYRRSADDDEIWLQVDQAAGFADAVKAMKEHIAADASAPDSLLPGDHVEWLGVLHGHRRFGGIIDFDPDGYATIRTDKGGHTRIHRTKLTPA